MGRETDNSQHTVKAFLGEKEPENNSVKDNQQSKVFEEAEGKGVKVGVGLHSRLDIPSSGANFLCRSCLC